jgi:hypothetical protein
VLTAAQHSSFLTGVSSNATNHFFLSPIFQDLFSSSCFSLRTPSAIRIDPLFDEGHVERQVPSQILSLTNVSDLLKFQSTACLEKVSDWLGLVPDIASPLLFLDEVSHL